MHNFSKKIQTFFWAFYQSQFFSKSWEKLYKNIDLSQLVTSENGYFWKKKILLIKKTLFFIEEKLIFVLLKTINVLTSPKTCQKKSPINLSCLPAMLLQSCIIQATNDSALQHTKSARHGHFRIRKNSTTELNLFVANFFWRKITFDVDGLLSSLFERIIDLKKKSAKSHEGERPTLQNCQILGLSVNN